MTPERTALRSDCERLLLLSRFQSLFTDESERHQKHSSAGVFAARFCLPSSRWEFHRPHTHTHTHLQLFAFCMSQILPAADVLYAVTALRASYGFSTRLARANKMPAFKVNPDGSLAAHGSNFVRLGAPRSHIRWSIPSERPVSWTRRHAA